MGKTIEALTATGLQDLLTALDIYLRENYVPRNEIVVPTIEVAVDTEDEFILRFTNANGESVLSPNLVRNKQDQSGS